MGFWTFAKGSLDAQDRQRALHLCQRSEEIAQANGLVQRFAWLLRARQGEALDAWLEEAEHCDIRELASFARGLRQDYSAVKAGLSLVWNNGPVEGHVNRLKLVKRSMYGRASFALLRTRYLNDG